MCELVDAVGAAAELALPAVALFPCVDAARKSPDGAEAWDPETASFEPAGSLIKARLQHTATQLPDGRVLVIGGTGAQWSAEAWDPERASFIPAGTLTGKRRVHTATALPDGRVLVVGGLPLDSSSLAEVWDPGGE